MKLLNKVKLIIEKYDLKPIELPNGYRDVYAYLRNNPHESINFESKKNSIVGAIPAANPKLEALTGVRTYPDPGAFKTGKL